MAQGTSTRQNASEKTARYEVCPGRYPISSRLPLNFTVPARESVATPRVSAIANANIPLSGLKSTATLAINPEAIHNHNAFLRLVDLSAMVAAKHIATAKKIVDVSVRIVAV